MARRCRWYLGLFGMGLLMLSVCLPVSVSAKKVKLTVWSNGWQVPILTQALKGFEKTHPNVTVEHLANIDRAKLLFSIATGTAPDLITLVTPIAELSDRGLLTPLNSYLKTSKVIRPGDYDQNLLDIFSTNGKVYGIPSIEVGAWLGLIYNKTAFQEAGLDPDMPARTLDDLKLVHRKLTKIQDGVIQRLGFNPTGSMGSIYFPETWGQVFGATCIDPKTRRINFNTPEMLKAVSYVSEFYDNITPQQLSTWWNKAGDWGASIGKGALAVEINGYWTPGQVALANPKTKVGTYWVPNVKGDKMMAHGGWSLCMPKGTKNPEEAWALIEYMTTKVPAQFIFDKMGFLNGNKRSLKELDLSSHPEVKWFLNSFDQADRVLTTTDAPMWDKCAREYLWNGIVDVAHRKKKDPAIMLKDVQRLVDIEMDKYYKKVAK